MICRRTYEEKRTLFAIGVARHLFGSLVLISWLWPEVTPLETENIMKSRIKKGARTTLQVVRDKTERQLQEPMKDPTLEGKDENKVGRIPEKSPPKLKTTP